MLLCLCLPFGGDLGIIPLSGKLTGRSTKAVIADLNLRAELPLRGWLSASGAASLYGIGADRPELVRGLLMPQAESWFSQRRKLTGAARWELWALFREAFLRAELGPVSLKIGRFAVPWEVSYFFSPLVLFSPPLRFGLSPYGSSGLDGVSLEVARGFQSFELCWLPTRSRKDRWGARARVYLSGFEVHMVTDGRRWGGAFVSNLSGGVVRLEGLRSGSGWSWVVSYDRRLPGGIYGLVEAVRGYRSPLGTSDRVAFRLERSADLWTLSAIGFLDLTSGEKLVWGEVGYSAFENMDLFSGGFLGRGKGSSRAGYLGCRVYF